MAEDIAPADLDPSTVGRLLDEYRDRLRRMVELRMDPRVRPRLDASDVLQDAFVEVTRRLPDYKKSPDAPFFLWVRYLTGQKLLELHRRHLTQKRAVHRDVHLASGGVPAASAETMARAIAASGMLSPSQEVAKDEQLQRLREVLDDLKPDDREVLVLRHFEHLSNREIAQLLALTDAGASLRYLRAARRLKEALERRKLA